MPRMTARTLPRWRSAWRAKEQRRRSRDRRRGLVDSARRDARHRQEVDAPPFIIEVVHHARFEVADLVEPDEEQRRRRRMSRQHEPDVGLDAAELATARIHRVKQDEPGHRKSLLVRCSRTSRIREQRIAEYVAPPFFWLEGDDRQPFQPAAAHPQRGAGV